MAFTVEDFPDLLRLLDAKFRGFELEDRYHKHSSAYFGPLLRRMRVHAPSVVVDQYEEQFLRSAKHDLLRAHMVVHGEPRDAPKRGEVWLVVEISATVDTHDVERATRRAATLRSASVQAIPTVASDQTTPAARERVQRDRVVLLEDGSIVGWDEALAAWTSTPV